jgi:hypothetical protein
MSDEPNGTWSRHPSVTGMAAAGADCVAAPVDGAGAWVGAKRGFR